MSSYLDADLASMIVDKVMSVLNCNINIMNEHGVIIGSGDVERIGQVHEGSMLAISQKRIVVIDEQSARSFQGVKPGVNIPLHLEDRIVGVIGMTGAPEQLNQYGLLISKIAEMMIEQARLMQHLAQNNRLREELVLNLVKEPEYSHELKALAKTLGLDLRLPRIAILAELESGQLGVSSAMAELKSLQSHLADAAEDDLMAILSLTEILILKPLPARDVPREVALLKQRFSQLRKKLKSLTNLELHFSIGNYFAGEGGIALSYQTARTTLKVGKLRYPQEACHTYFDMELPVLLDGLSAGWQSRHLLGPIQALKQKDSNGVLYKTLLAWFANNTSATLTIEKLFIHRNTLDYRLNRIGDITGMDLGRFEDKLLLYISLHLDNL